MRDRALMGWDGWMTISFHREIFHLAEFCSHMKLGDSTLKEQQFFGNVGMRCRH